MERCIRILLQVMIPKQLFISLRVLEPIKQMNSPVLFLALPVDSHIPFLIPLQPVLSHIPFLIPLLNSLRRSSFEQDDLHKKALEKASHPRPTSYC